VFSLFYWFLIFIYLFIGRNIKDNPYNTCAVIVTVHDLCEKKSGLKDFKAIDNKTEWYSVF
jgi:hypothetical protein